MGIKNQALREYAELLHANGFTIYEPTTRGFGNYFLYSREINGVELFGNVQADEFGSSYSHHMPIHPTREHGSSMFVDHVPDELTVETARLITRATNYNRLVGWQTNYRDVRSLKNGRYVKWETVNA